MKSITFTTFIVVLCIVFTVFTQTTQANRHAYDVVQKVGDLRQNLQMADIFEDFEKEWNSSRYAWRTNIEKLNWLIENFKNGSNGKCVQDLLYTAESIKLENITQQWGLQMVDAFGKPESGILKGNLKWIGEFDECRNVYAPLMPNSTTVGGFHGKYCSLQFTTTILPLPITLGLCLPDSCHPADFIQNDVTTEGPMNVTSFTCTSNTRQLSNAAIATVCLLSIFLLLAFLGSSITVLKHLNLSENSKTSVDNQTIQSGDNDQLLFTENSRTKFSAFVEESKSFLNCFCIFTNGSKLLNTDSTEGQLLCLHGIRFLSMSWVILCHTYMSPVAQLKSLVDLKGKVENWPFQAILNGWYSVDSFFLLSGFLMAYLYFQECAKRKGKTPWLYFYIHRYLRLTPVYMLALAFYATIFPYLGSGPFWPDYDVDPNCHKYWWWNLLYINNFNNSADVCFGWAWYLANDMQFFIVSPIFLITLWRWPKIGSFLLSLFLLGNLTISFVLTYHYNLVAGSLSDVSKIALDPMFMIKWDEYFNKIYMKPYTRCGPYLIGIAFGYLMFKRKATHFQVNDKILWIGWILAIPMGLTCIYGLYHNSPTLVGASFYNAFTRPVYALSLSWVIFVCLIGKGGAVDKILSYKLFIPLSRLTYAAYLIHFIIIHTYFSSLKVTFDFSHQSMVLLFLGLISVTYALSLLVSLVFESPVIRLEKYLRGKFQS